MPDPTLPLAPLRRRPSLPLGLLAAALITGTGPRAGAADATWVGATADWADPANWTSSPDVPDGTATFRNSGSTAVDISSLVLIGAIQFTAAPNASGFTITNSLDIFAINGAGIFNNSTSTQTLNVTGGSTLFQNASTASGGAGPAVDISNSSFLTFQDTSTTGNAHLANTLTGFVDWYSNSTAGTAIITNDGSATFNDDSNAGTAHITNNASGTLIFYNSSTAQGATILNSGGVQFNNTSRAGNASITNDAFLDFAGTASADHATVRNNAAITFSGASTAGNAVVTYGADFASTSFFDSSSAGSATFQSDAGISGNYTTFADTSTAGSATITNSSGVVLFSNASTAASAHISNTGSLALGVAVTAFDQTSTAGNATISNNFGGGTSFEGQSVAGTATITNNPGGSTLFGIAGSSTASADHASILNAAGPGALGTGGITEFFSSTTAGNATITTQTAAAVAFFDTSSGGAARFITDAGGVFDMSQLTSSGMTAGSIEGAGTYYLGDKQLTVGGNNLSTLVSGIISDGSCGCFGPASTGASLVKVGSGTLTLAGANTYTGGTTISAGTLQVGNGGASGTLGTGNVVNNATLAFNRSDAFIFANAISGSGAVDQIGTGATTLTATNSYTGPTTVSAGALVIGAGGSITSNVINAATFINNGIVTGNLTNSGTFENAAGASLSGLLTSSAGSVFNNGALDGGATISGGSLTGTGSVATLTIGTGATFIPGNGTAGSAMTVTGNLAFQSGALYVIQLTPATASLTTVGGTANLNGGVTASFGSGTYVSRKYTIIDAASVIGSFTTLTTSGLPSGFKSSLSYDAGHAYLDLTLSFIPPIAPGSGIGFDQNQLNVANAMVGFFNRTGSIPLVFGSLTAVGLTQLSGETATGSQQATFDAMNLFMGLLADPFIAGRSGAPSAGGAYGFADDSLAYAGSRRRSGAERDAYGLMTKAVPPTPTFEQRWSTWTAGFGGAQTTDGNATLGSNRATSRVYGGAVGADYRFSPDTLAGFAMAGGGTNFSVANSGSGHSDLFQAGAFIRHSAGPAYVTGALAYGWQDVTTERTVAVAGTNTLRANFNANAWSGRIEGGYRLANTWLAITPYAAGQFTTYELPSYAESTIPGAGLFALSYVGKSVTASRSELGLRSDKSWALGDGIFTLRGRAAWAHDFNTDRNVQATFQSLPGAGFVVNGASAARDAALATASAELKFASGISLAATFEGEFSEVTRSYAGKGVARYVW